MLEKIKTLENFSPRCGKKEKDAVKYIEKEIANCGLDIEIQEFKNTIPVGKADLEADSEKIECEPTSLISGEFEEKCLISSIHISSRIFSDPNINFNPYCKKISLATFYFAPSVAIRREDVSKIIKSEEIYCKVLVEKERFTSKNILVGNIKKPKHILFAHYDTVLNGAIDNASGTALCIELIQRFPEIVKNNLVVFSGSEELSFDRPIYWGKGYRIFEEEYLELLNKCHSIVVVDCVGFASPEFIKSHLISAFPINNLEKLKDKIFLLSVKEKYFSKLWNVYHSELDKVDNICKNYLDEALKKLYSYLLS